jgi:hypothetical protein
MNENTLQWWVMVFITTASMKGYYIKICHNSSNTNGWIQLSVCHCNNCMLSRCRTYTYEVQTTSQYTVCSQKYRMFIQLNIAKHGLIVPFEVQNTSCAMCTHGYIVGCSCNHCCHGNSGYIHHCQQYRKKEVFQWKCNNELPVCC